MKINDPLDRILVETPTDSLPRIDDAYNLINEDIAFPEQVIEGLLHRGSKMILGGGSKSYKTWILIDLALSISTGSPWQGFPTLQSNVLYLNMEIQRPFFKERLTDVLMAKGIDNISEGALLIWNLRGKTKSLAELQEKLQEVCVTRDVRVIIIDPIYKFYGGRDENSVGDMSEVLLLIDSIAENCGASVIFGAHFSKGNQAGKESLDRISGSGVFARDADAILTLTKHRLEGVLVVESVLRNCPPVKPFCITWSHPLMVRKDDANPAHLKKPGGKGPIYCVEELIDTLDILQLTYNELIEKFGDEYGASRSTTKRLIGEAKRIGIHRLGPGIKKILQSTIIVYGSKYHASYLPLNRTNRAQLPFRN